MRVLACGEFHEDCLAMLRASGKEMNVNELHALRDKAGILSIEMP